MRIRGFLIFSLVSLLLFAAACTRTEDFIIVRDAEKGISVDIKALIEKKPVFYKAEFKGSAFEFFVIKINGEPKAFLNRCRKCYNSGLGFRFDDTHVQCRACNESFPIEDIAHGVGSCYPISLNSRVEGEKITVKLEPLSR